MAISEFISYLKNEKRYSSHTIISYEKDLFQWNEFLQLNYDKISTIEAEAIMLRSWIVSLVEKGLTAKTINRKISTLKSYYKYLYSNNIIESLPTSKLISPKLKKGLPTYVKEAEMDVLLNKIEYGLDASKVIALRDKLIIELLYATGIRLSELVGLKFNSINWTNKTIKVLGKRNKERIIPLHQQLIDDLIKYNELRMELGNSEFLMMTDSGNKLYSKFVYRKVNYYLSQVTSLAKKSPHVIRHTFATHMLNNGADLNTIKEFLGHSNLSATEVYTHNSLEKIKNIYKQAHPRA